MSPLLEMGIAIDISHVSSRDIAQLKPQLRSLGKQNFRMVFFSPFTYEFHHDYRSMLNWRSVAYSRQQTEDIAFSLAGQIDAMLTLLAENFDCPIFVHNVSGLLREESAAEPIMASSALNMLCGAFTSSGAMTACAGVSVHGRS